MSDGLSTVVFQSLVGDQLSTDRRILSRPDICDSSTAVGDLDDVAFGRQSALRTRVLRGTADPIGLNELDRVGQGLAHENELRPEAV